MTSGAMETKHGEGILPPAGKVAHRGFSNWAVLTLIALAMLNASWATAFFRLFEFTGTQRSMLTIMMYFTALPLMTVLAVSVVRSLRLTGSVERFVSLAILVLGVLTAFPLLLYPGDGPGLGAALARYLSAFTNLEFALRSEPITTVLILIFWRRGLSMARHRVGPRVVQRDLRTGLIALLLIGFAAASLDSPLPYVEVFILLFAALMAMGGARLSALSFMRGGRTIPFESGWFLAVAAGAGGLLAFTGVMAAIGAEPLAQGAGRILSIMGSALGALLLFLLRPVIVLLTELFSDLIGSLVPRTSELPELPTGQEVSQIIEGLSEEIAPAPFAGGLLDTIQIILIAAAILIVVIVVYFSLRSTRAGKIWRNLEEGEREALLGSLPDYLRTLLRDIRRTPDILDRLNPAAQVIAAARIRQIYRQLLRLSSRLGVEREQAETPLEFLADLPVVFPDSQRELERITHAYLRVRYGEYPESRQEVDQVEQAWRYVRKRGRPLPEES